MSLKKKGGLTDPITGTTIAIIIGIIGIVVLLNVSGKFWDFFIQSDEIEDRSTEAFSGINLVILRIGDNPGAKENVPVQISEDYSLVAFSSSGEECKSIARPLKTCETACFCICENEYGEQMCNSRLTECASFGEIGLDFQEICSVIEGSGEIEGVVVENVNGKIGLKSV